MEKKQERVAIAGKAQSPLNSIDIVTKDNYMSWANYCLSIIAEVRKDLVSYNYILDDSRGTGLTGEQASSYEECHRMWLQKGYEMDERIIKSFNYFISVLKGSDKKSFNSYEAERIIKLCDYLLFQYNKALGVLKTPEIIGTVDSLLAKKAILPVEADIYSAKARKDAENQGFRIVIHKDKPMSKEDADTVYSNKQKIKDILLRQGKDKDAIESLLLLCDDPYVAEMVANKVEKTDYVSVYQPIQIAEELRGDFKKVA